MTPVTRVKYSSAALAAALLLGLAAPAASAHAPARDAHRVPFTAATVTDNADGTSTIAWTAPGVRTVAIRSEGRTVARGGATGSVTAPVRPGATCWSADRPQPSTTGSSSGRWPSEARAALWRSSGTSP
ncbi:hypothetical protein ABZ621_29400 [Streptomyces sp. NPDC007863]|uniref:hypothetical protein n=1 Tax=Streptomyces sp. NPDC007863 TaxID=3154894 RepID=UPI0033D1AD8F